MKTTIDLSNWDLRLLDVSLELEVMKDYLQLVEKQIGEIKAVHKYRLDAELRKNSILVGDPEYDGAIQDYEFDFEFLIPRFFRGAFIVALYSIYEAAITEIANLMREREPSIIPFRKIRVKNGGFLKRAEKYFKDYLKFNLCSDSNAWDKIEMLADIRHAIAHTNGRIEMINQNGKEKIMRWERQKIGIDSFHGYLVFEAKILQDFFSAVSFSINDLVKRYKQLPETLPKSKED